MKLVTNHIFKIKAKDGASVTFVPNSSQQKIIDVIQKHERAGTKARLMIIKGRQMGGSSCIQRIQLSYAMTRPNFAGYTVAHDGESVRQIFQNHVKYSFDTLPDVFRNLYKVDRNNANQVKFYNTECFNSSMTVGQSARSNTIDFLHVSEAAKIADDKAKWQELITGSFEAARNGHIILETTALGFNAFYDFVQDKLKDKSAKWQILFLGWYDSQEYRLEPPDDEDWKKQYKALASRYELCQDPQKDYGLDDHQLYFYYDTLKDIKELVKQEYPLNMDEAFVTTAQTAFRMQDLLQAEKELTEPFKVNSMGAEFYVPPEPGMIYAIGVDPRGEGAGKGADDAGISCWCFQTGEQVAEYRGKGSPEDTGFTAISMAKLYNEAYIACEVGGVGLFTHKVIKNNYRQDRIYRRLVVDETDPRRPKIPKYGWDTTGDSRPKMIFEFINAFENKVIKVNSKALINQAKTFVKKENERDTQNKKIRYEHQTGKHDDTLFAAMIALQTFKFIAERR
jgi:hypothetical protein